MAIRLPDDEPKQFEPLKLSIELVPIGFQKSGQVYLSGHTKLSVQCETPNYKGFDGRVVLEGQDVAATMQEMMLSMITKASSPPPDELPPNRR